MYVGKRVEFTGIRCQVARLWALGEKVQSGAIVDDTRVSDCGVCCGASFVVVVDRSSSDQPLHISSSSFRSVLRCGNLIHQVLF